MLDKVTKVAKLPRFCQNCRFKIGTWCTNFEAHKRRKAICGSHNYKKTLNIGR